MQWLKNQYSASENWSSGGHKSPVVCFAMVSPMSDSHIFFCRRIGLMRIQLWMSGYTNQQHDLCHPPTYIEDTFFRLSCCLCHTLLGFFCCCYDSLLCLGKSFHEHIHGWRVSSHSSGEKKNKRKEKKKDSTLPVRFFSAFYPRMGGKIQSNWKGWQLLKNYIIYTHILCSFHPHLY